VIYHLRPNALEHHPSGWLARTALDPAWSSVECAPSAAAMACELQQGALDDYLAAVGAGRPIGLRQLAAALSGALRRWPCAAVRITAESFRISGSSRR
tara:strand:+ start:390 stop:683 length:294 start_codon:yes stop_codon:yes gene_type:complete